MEEFAKVLGLYDVVSYFIPGAIAVWAALEAFGTYCALHNDGKHPRPISMPAFLFSAFVAGHLIQAVMSPLDDVVYRARGKDTVEKHYYKPEQQRFKVLLEEKMEAAFKGNSPEDMRALCEVYAQVRGLDTHTEKFLAYRGLFRGLALALLLSSFAFCYVYWSAKGRGKAIPRFLCIALLVGCLISIARWDRFNDYWLDSIYRTFYVNYSLLQ